jgi:hypothetical protein
MLTGRMPRQGKVSAVPHSRLDACRLLPPALSSGPATVAPSAMVVEELFATEGELRWREEALTTREEKVRISEKALVQVSATLDEERTKAEAVSAILDEERTKAEVATEEYLDNIEAHTTHDKLILNLDKILGEKMVELNERERDLELRTMVLVESQAWGLNPRDHHDELMEFINLRWLLRDVEAD